ncbi:histidine--tRNA ligase [Patescibacteria group bacterium]|nr:histidine--tRNA ligase [Patescibacteria group bacterium]
MSGLVKPELPGGFQDYLPEEQQQRMLILRAIEDVYKSFGFLPLDTPEIEKWSVLTGNEPTDMRIYRVGGLSEKNLGKDAELGLRFDLTVPLARVVAAYGNSLPKPFKRYQLGRVFRGESSQKGRFNGFYQFDIDIVYSSSVVADAEIIAIIWSTFQALGISDVIIKINDRKILNGLAEIVGISDKSTEFFRILDRLEKAGLETVVSDLERKPENNYDDSALAFSTDQIKSVVSFLELSNLDDPLSAAMTFFDGRTQVGTDGVIELQEVVKWAKLLDVPEEKISVDLSVARGLGYYTGPVFETVLTKLPSIGSVFSGGRFDGLVGRFSNTSVPATGASIGVDRLFAALKELELLDRFSSPATQVLIAIVDQDHIGDYLQLSVLLREAGITTEVYIGKEKGLKSQIAYALNQDVPIMVIAGSNELSLDSWQVKDLRTREQNLIHKDSLVSHIQSIL